MALDLTPLTAASTIGIAFGLALLVKGMAGQRRAARIGDTATSTISAIAVGEVRVSGVVEPAEISLTSPLQSRTCVYYRARIEETEGRSERSILKEERAVGFRVRDASGEVRVFPRGAQWLVPDAFKESTGIMGDEPLGLQLRTGSAVQSGVVDHDTEIARLLTVQAPSETSTALTQVASGGLLGGFGIGGRRDYREARIELGQVVTIVGIALPFDQLPDPTGADAMSADGLDASGGIADAEIAADLAAAREAGTLEADPREAWGNAAIPGVRGSGDRRAPRNWTRLPLPSPSPAPPRPKRRTERSTSRRRPWSWQRLRAPGCSSRSARRARPPSARRPAS